MVTAVMEIVPFDLDEDLDITDENNIDWESDLSTELLTPAKNHKVSCFDTEPVRIYLNEVGTYPLLTPTQEIELAKIIAKYKDILLFKQELSKDLKEPPSVDVLCKRLHITPDRFKSIQNEHAIASKKLSQANLRLVVSIAKKYTNQNVLFLDLIQEGNIGLMRAVEKFDHTKGYRFSTYATWWIRQAITRSIAEHARTIRLPVHIIESISKMRKVYRELTQKHGRFPTELEMAEEMIIPIKKLRDLKKLKQDSISLTCLVTPDSDNTIEESIEDKLSITPFEMVMNETRKQDIVKILSILDVREQYILKARHGLLDGEPHSLEHIGRTLGVSRERVRQIESKAMRKLRESLKASLLLSHLQD
jgi:RNA polymerase sigma factor (sigma-70 family)